MVSVNFNQDCSSLAVGGKGGYQLYSLNNVEQIERIYQNDQEYETYIVERLFSSSLLVVVTHSNPCSLKVCHFKKGTEICNYSYPSKILSVKLNRQRLVVCLANSYHVHNIRDMKIMHTLEDTPCNPAGLCALSVGNDTGYIAYPGSTTDGSLEIFDSMTMTSLVSIPAHHHPLSAATFSPNSQMVATASSKGTVLRIFSTTDGAKLFEFRRGLSRCVNISSLAFSTDGMFLCASSNTSTVHIFKLTPQQETEPENVGWTDYLKSSAASLIPSTVSEVFNAWRDFATARLSEGGKRTICGVSYVKKLPHIVVADEDGMVHVFKLNTECGGECELVTTRRLSFHETMDGECLDEKIDTTDYQNNSKDSMSSDHSVSDASYAYKLKREKRAGPPTTSQELNEIVDNVSAVGGKAEPGAMEKLRLDDPSEFPPMK